MSGWCGCLGYGASRPVWRAPTGKERCREALVLARSGSVLHAAKEVPARKEARNKDFRSDITEGKRTLVAVHALAHSSHRDELVQILQSGATDQKVLSRAVEIFEEAGSIDFARDYSFKLTAQAKELLANVELDNHCKELFMSMADFFVERLS